MCSNFVCIYLKKSEYIFLKIYERNDMRKIFFLICSVCVFLVKQQILEKKPRTTLDEYETLTEYNFPIRKFNFKSPRRFSPKRKTTIIHTLIFIKLKYDTYEHKKTKRIFFVPHDHHHHHH